MTNTEGPIVIDTPEGIDFFRLLQFQMRLRLETGTRPDGTTGGFKFGSRIPTLKYYNAQFGTSFKSKVKALADCDARIEAAKEMQTDGEME